MKLTLTDDGGEGFEAVFVDNVVGWKLVSLPWEVFRRADWQPEGAPNDGLTLTAVSAYGFFMIPGTSGHLYFDEVQLFETPVDVIDDFEALDWGEWYWDADWGNTVMTTTVVTEPHLTVAGQIMNSIFSLEFVSEGWGGATGHNLPAPQDWSGYDGVSFWLHGTNSGISMKLTLTDDGGEGFEAVFVDNVVGWKLVSLPWEVFRRADWQPEGAPNDGLTLTAVSAYGFFMIPGTSGHLYFDQVAVFDPQATFYIDQIANPPGAGELGVNFANVAYSVDEGDEAIISVELTAASSEPVTVTYTSSDGTAIAGVDYVAVSGTLGFPADTLAQTFVVQTIDNDAYEGNRDLNLVLSEPVNATLGPRDQATLTIVEDELANVCALRATTIDDFDDGELPYGTDGDGLDIGFFTWVGPASTVAITTTQMVTDTVLQMDSQVAADSWGGMTHHFENEAVDTWLPQDWSDYEAVSFWVYGTNSGSQLFFEIQDNRNPDSAVDDTEIWTYPFIDDFDGWRRFEVMFTEFTRKEISNGAPNDGFTLTEVHGWAFGSTAFEGTLYLDDVQICGFAEPPELQVAFDQPEYDVDEAYTAVISVSINATSTSPVRVSYRTAEGYAIPDRDYTPVSGKLVIKPGDTSAAFEVSTLGDSKFEGDETLMLVLSDAMSATLGFQRRAVLNIVDDDLYDPALVHDFEGYHSFLDASGSLTLTVSEVMESDAIARPEQDIYEHILGVDYYAPTSTARIVETFVQGQDWRGYSAISFWYYGTNTGNTVTVEILDSLMTTTAEADPAEWELVWSDEFEQAAGTPPDPNVWKHEIGDGTLNGIPGWGNSEREFYTDSVDNAATDGAGNLVITLSEVDTSTTQLQCWYGPCENTSARLISENRVEFEYGRIEARMRVPTGPEGLWPAFWMLGTDISEVDWPECGEIDIMEYVSWNPDEIFGTIHGPGYSGGASFGDTWDFGEPVSNTFHTFAVEWQPDHIDWYVDDILYHTAEPVDVAPNDWVFNHPFYIIMNLAIGGNFGGAVSEEMTYPQELLVDYVRVYQAADTAERFEYSFADDFDGWMKITVPLNELIRSEDQPDGAPNDGLNLTQVRGYGLRLSAGSTGSFYLDQVRLIEKNRSYLPIVWK